VTSPVAGVSVNPPPFAGGQVWDFDVTKSPHPDKHFVVFYKDVVDSSFAVQNFSIKLKAILTPALSPSDLSLLNPRWTKLSGPNSGMLSSTTGIEVNYVNPKQGGVYRFAFDMNGYSRTEFCVVLPLAGAEMDGVMQDCLKEADKFVARMKARYSPRELRETARLEKWFVNFNSGDYVGRPDNQATPSVWYYGQVQTIKNPPKTYGLGAVCTWKGRPVRMAKMTNFIVGYTMQQFGVSHFRATGGLWTSLFGTPDGPTATASFDAGWYLAQNGGDYNTVVSSLVNYIWTNEKPDDKTKKPWPNPNPPGSGNFGGTSQDSMDLDRQYGVPAFLFRAD